MKIVSYFVGILTMFMLSYPVCAQPFPGQSERSVVLRDFRFNTGEVMPELRINFVTIGQATNEPVLLLHGTTGSGLGMVSPVFGAQLFGPGQPLDASKYFIILPDSIGTGKSSKPSDGLRTKFPRYNYDDMVTAQYRLVTEHLGIKRLRLVLGNSMGGMHTWLWAQKYPDMMDIAVPMASLPAPMSGRNWMLRRMLTDSIRNDPEWMGGEYTKQPKSAQFASVFFAVATNGGNQALMRGAPDRKRADAMLDARLKAPFAGDANDHLYQWESSGDYDPSAKLEDIKAHLFAINSSDDERNPPELGILDREIKRIKNGKILLIPGSPMTAGHGTTGQAKFWKSDLAQWLQSVPKGP